MRHKAAIGFIGIGFGAAALAASGDALVVTGEGVNVRARPSLSATALMQARRGERAVELGREGEWVEVRLDEQGVQGWIHQSLVAPDAPAEPDVDGPEDAAAEALSEEVAQALERFRRSVDYLDWRAGAAEGDLFAEVRWLGRGTVQVLATAAWDEVPPDEQGRLLETLFDRWVAATDTAGPLRVEIVGPGGAVSMDKTGP